MDALQVYGLAFAFIILVGWSLGSYVRYLNRISPPPSGATIDLGGSDALRRFRKLDGRANGLFLLLAIGFGVPLFLLLHLLEQLRIAVLPMAQLTFPITDAFWGCVAMFAGMGLALASFLPLAMRKWPDDTPWYARYLSVVRYKCDYARLCRVGGTAIAAIALVAAPFGFNGYVQLRNDVLAIHPAFALAETDHRYSDIASIETARGFVAPNGRTRYERMYVVHFKDGSRWSVRDLPSGDFSDDEQVAQMLSRKSGIAFTEVPIFRGDQL